MSIEATHVGEHGKGFAVVADEFRKLEEASSNFMENISNLLLHIQEVPTVAEEISAGSEEAAASVHVIAQISIEVYDHSHKIYHLICPQAVMFESITHTFTVLGQHIHEMSKVIKKQ